MLNFFQQLNSLVKMLPNEHFCWHKYFPILKVHLFLNHEDIVIRQLFHDDFHCTDNIFASDT